MPPKVERAKDGEPAPVEVETPSGDFYLFAYTALSGGKTRLFAVATTAAGPVKLDSEGSHPSLPKVSGDGKSIAYTASVEGKNEILLFDGQDSVNLTNGFAKDNWLGGVASDGSKVVSSTLADSNLDIFLFDKNGDKLQLSTGATDETEPRISRDGTGVTFTRITLEKPGQTKSDVYFVMADGSGLKKLTDNSAHNYSPDISPDGSRICYISTELGSQQLFIVNADGSGLRRAPGGSHMNCSDPTFSPDGKKILFNATGYDQESPQEFDIFELELDKIGSLAGLKNLTQDIDYHCQSPYYSTDGKRIFFLQTDTLATMTQDDKGMPVTGQVQRQLLMSMPITGGKAVKVH